MRFHLLAIPHTVTHKDYVACAYTQKVLKFAKMMKDRGHTVYHYGHERSQLECSEHITVTDDAVLEKAYGSHDWRRHQFKHNVQDHANQTFIHNTIPEVLLRARPGDFLLCTWGFGHQAIAQAVESSGVIPVEPGIGYTSGQFARWRAFESHAVRNISYDAGGQDWYARVIPNYFDPEDFEFSDKKQDYVLYLGRVTELKGISACVQATEAAGVELKIAGQGSLLDLGYEQIPEHVEELGYADTELRKSLMRDASALIIASTYLEPFGGVQVEALLSGTPVIAPHFGAFSEVQRHGETGFLCHTLKDYVSAIQLRNTIDPEVCRARGMQYSLANIAPEFESWFESITDVYTAKGWNQL
tara:strand:+ start:7506 stop:8579 length:1074 start_codon:yes stop_codon:yes gene_type:complete